MAMDFTSQSIIFHLYLEITSCRWIFLSSYAQVSVYKGFYNESRLQWHRHWSSKEPITTMQNPETLYLQVLVRFYQDLNPNHTALALYQLHYCSGYNPSGKHWLLKTKTWLVFVLAMKTCRYSDLAHP